MSWRNLTIRNRLLIMVASTALVAAAIPLWGVHIHRQTLLDERKADAVQAVETAYRLLQGIQSDVSAGQMTLEEAQAMARRHVRDLQHGESGYVWLHDLEGRVVAHPARPDLEARVFPATEGGGVEATLSRMNQAVADGEAFFEYPWRRADGSADVKLSYLKRFEPWGWVIGSGIHLAQVSAVYRSDLITVFVVLFLVGLGATAVTVVVSRSIAIPLSNVTRELMAIAGMRDVAHRGRSEIALLREAMGGFKRSVEQNEKLLAERIELVRNGEERVRSILESLPFPVFVTSLGTGTLLYANRGAREVAAGLDPETPMLEALCAGDHRAADELLARLKRDGALGGVEIALPQVGGKPVWAMLSLSTMSLDGETAVVGGLVDVTARREAEDRLRKLSAAVEQSPSSLVITDTEGMIEYVNPRFTELSGYRPEEVVGRHIRMLKSGHLSDDQSRAMWTLLTEGGTWSGEFHNRRKDGATYWVSSIISPIKDGAGRITHYLQASEDVSVTKEYESRLSHQATHDALTGLPNRALALARLTEALTGPKADGQVVVLFLDLDQFGLINQSLGHELGDRLICEAAQRLESIAPVDATLAHIGADEYLLIAPALPDVVAVEALASRVLAAFREPFMLEGRPVTLGLSVGIALAPEDGDEAAELVRNAETAMGRAKALGGNAFCYFLPEFNDRARERLRIESQLRQALERDEFELHFQPLVEIGSHRIVGAEALLRWHNPVLGTVRPDVFIPIAEDTGLIVAIGEWVLREAVAQASRWLASRPLKVAVNLSYRQFRDPHLVDTVRTVLAEAGLPARLLELEVTERLLIEDVEETAKVLEQLRTLGVSLSVDDFGTGYSALSYLRRFPFDTLKIDRDFLRNVPDDPRDSALATSIVDMARRLHLKVIAEGVETVEQLAFLERAGADVAQGYLFSRPLPAADFACLFQQSLEQARQVVPA